MSFSQNHEDLELIKRYRLGNFGVKTYIELGALDGVRYSNTKYLEDSYGWTGILIEPNPASFLLLEKNRPNNILVNALVSNSNSTIDFEYFENPHLAAVSSSRETRPQHVQDGYFTKGQDNQWLDQQIDSLKSTAINPISLADICNDSLFDKFGLLSLDVEGHELSVLQSHDWKKEIAIILVEENGNPELRPYLESRRYRHDGEIANNTLYVPNIA